MKKTIILFGLLLTFASCSQQSDSSGQNLTGDLTLKQKLIQWSPWTTGDGLNTWVFTNDSITFISVDTTETTKCVYGSSSFSFTNVNCNVISITQQELMFEQGGTTWNFYHQ